MTDPTEKPCYRGRGRAAVLGAVTGLILIWAVVIGVYLYEGDIESAIIWSAVAVCGVTAVLLPLFGGGPRK